MEAVERERYLTTRQVADILQVAPKTVTAWAANGKLDSWLTPGGRRRYWESQVRAYLNNR